MSSVRHELPIGFPDALGEQNDRGAWFVFGENKGQNMRNVRQYSECVGQLRPWQRCKCVLRATHKYIAICSRRNTTIEEYISFHRDQI